MPPAGDLRAATLVWFGSAAFRIDTPGGKRVYVDPWLENSDCPQAERSPERVDLIVVTHGHFDHVGQTMELWRAHRPPVVAAQDLRRWLECRGLERDERLAPDKGGTVTVGEIAVSLTDARHGSAAPDGGYGTDPCGCVIALEDGTSLYFAGDTCVFGDMRLIGRLYEPDVAVLPIGGHYTMDPRQAAVALELLGARRCVPCHFRAHGLGEVSAARAALPGTPAQLRELVDGVEIVAPDPGAAVEI